MAVELRAPALFRGGRRDGNVSRAALKLHVSQRVLGRQIRDRDDEIGFSLLKRT